MHTLGALALRWVISAVITMLAVGFVSPKNPSNTLTRALGVTAIVAVLIAPVMWFWVLLIPALVGMALWFLVYRFAYNLGLGQAFGVGVVQIALAFLVDWLVLR